jgi:hypothetical protein
MHILFESLSHIAFPKNVDWKDRSRRFTRLAHYFRKRRGGRPARLKGYQRPPRGVGSEHRRACERNPLMGRHCFAASWRLGAATGNAVHEG